MALHHARCVTNVSRHGKVDAQIPLPTLHSLIFKGEEFINQDSRNKLIRKNQWAAFFAAVMALSMGFGLFKLVGMIKFK